MNTYPRQLQPPTQIEGKLDDLHMTGPFARERGPCGPTVVGPVFRTELLRSTPEPPRPTQTLNEQCKSSAHSAGQSDYITGLWSL
jgi:hypothetical protein